MKFMSLKISGWRQFDEIDIALHPRLTVIAGANGAGKSTLLRLLSQHFGYSNSLIATPIVSTSGVFRYLSGIFGRKDERPSPSVGSVGYSDGKNASLVIPADGSPVYTMQIPGMQNVMGLFINSHRPINIYQAITSIPTNAIGVEQAYQAYNQEVINRFNNSYSQYSPTYRIKEAIISMATFGPGNRNVAQNSVLDRAYEEFKEMLRRVLPPSIGFVDINIRIPDVVIVTQSGEFVLDASSGGLMALIDLAWQIFLFSREKGEFVAIIDEPENHLHPSMQRSIIGNLLDAFPQAQFIVATHSPFVVSSVKESHVYVLRYKDNDSDMRKRTVYSQKLDNVNKAGSAGDILRSVLGVPVTLPLWAEDAIERISNEFILSQLDAEGIRNLRTKLEAEGLGDYYADALGRMAKNP